MLQLKHLLGILWLSVHLFEYVYASGGESTQFRKQDDHGNYKFGYDINDGYGGNHFHKETGDKYGTKRGSYGILGADGKMRIVHYIADENGFRVDIKSNEEGIAQGKDSASAIVNGKDIDEHSDYSSSFGQRTAGYHTPSSSPLYLSSSSHHPSSKPYYLSSLSSKSVLDHSENIEPPTSYHETVPETPYISTKPKYSNYALAAKSYYPKNLAYVPKYTSGSSGYLSHHYPKPMAYEAPSYSSSYHSPSYGTSSSAPSYDSNSYSSGSYEPNHYPTPVHRPSYVSEQDYSGGYESPVYGTRKTSYASDLYGKSAEPVHSFVRLSGFSKKKHEEKTKYFDEPYESSPVALAKPTSGLLETSSTTNTIQSAVNNVDASEKKKEDHEVAEDYKTQPKTGIISTKPRISGLIGLTSYRNPYSIDTVYKSS